MATQKGSKEISAGTTTKNSKMSQTILTIRPVSPTRLLSASKIQELLDSGKYMLVRVADASDTEDTDSVKVKNEESFAEGYKTTNHIPEVQSDRPLERKRKMDSKKFDNCSNRCVQEILPPNKKPRTTDNLYNTSSNPYVSTNFNSRYNNYNFYSSNYPYNYNYPSYNNFSSSNSRYNFYDFNERQYFYNSNNYYNPYNIVSNRTFASDRTQAYSNSLKAGTNLGPHAKNNRTKKKKKKNKNGNKSNKFNDKQTNKKELPSSTFAGSTEIVEMKTELHANNGDKDKKCIANLNMQSQSIIKNEEHYINQECWQISCNIKQEIGEISSDEGCQIGQNSSCNTGQGCSNKQDPITAVYVKQEGN